jgi:hypothetical protein
LEILEDGTAMQPDEKDLPSLGQTIFGETDLGDIRRTKRLVTVFEQFRRHPGGTLPEKLKSPKDLRALYRLCARPEVTHEAILEAICGHTFAMISQHPEPIVILHDGTELDYTSLTSLSGQLGQIGKGYGRGYICHNSLAVDPAGREVFGLTHQILHRRVKRPKKETLPQSRARKSRESLLWLRGTAGLPADWHLVDVCDQGADTFEFLEHESRSGRRFVIRSKQQRVVYGVQETPGKRQPLSKYVRSLPVLGSRTLEIQFQHGKPCRRARKGEFQISAAAVQVPRPHAKHGNHGKEPLQMWVVRIFEMKPPPGQKRLEWVLSTNEPVATIEDALRVIGWYETRWVIEELHKAMKTGCGIEELQFTTTERLNPLIAVLSAVATTLLNLRTASRREDATTRPATDVVSVEYVQVLSGWRYGHVRDNLTVWEFFYALARLGGHQNRKHDKRPGWLVLWRGWNTLQAMLDGAEAIQRKKCG